jgi:hypothetical protein
MKRLAHRHKKRSTRKNKKLKNGEENPPEQIISLS